MTWRFRELFTSLMFHRSEFLLIFSEIVYSVGDEKEKVTELKWSEVDLNNGTVRLNPSGTKNEKGRTVYLDTELQDIFADLWQARKASAR